MHEAVETTMHPMSQNQQKKGLDLEMTTGFQECMKGNSYHSLKKPTIIKFTGIKQEGIHPLINQEKPILRSLKI